MPKTNPVHLSLRKALTSDRLEEFIAQEEARGAVEWDTPLRKSLKTGGSFSFPTVRYGFVSTEFLRSAPGHHLLSA